MSKMSRTACEFIKEQVLLMVNIFSSIEIEMCFRLNFEMCCKYDNDDTNQIVLEILIYSKGSIELAHPNWQNGAHINEKRRKFVQMSHMKSTHMQK